ncbi:nuclear transcription factor Y subunit B-3 [Acrasis kona]|uniref:Nuclear transcription factor Y subunit B-3 n=1 Tax=Acrasis kona TaxID=1008807 RepID=A0AAW2Z0A1_9EUKA
MSTEQTEEPEEDLVETTENLDNRPKRRPHQIIQPFPSGDQQQPPYNYMMHSNDENQQPTDEELMHKHPNFQEIKEQDRFLPIANINRIMKKSLPANAKISKEAKECVQECVSEYISFITNEASDLCVHEKRKTINGNDLLRAMQNLGFESYFEPLRLYLQRYQDFTKGDKTTKSGKRKQDE